MGYRMITIDILFALWTRLKANESRRAIAKQLGLDRKTVEKYEKPLLSLDLPPDTRFQDALPRLEALLHQNRRAKPAMAVLERYRKEIKELLETDASASGVMKLTTAWEVLTRLHDELRRTSSYESFKRFCADPTILAKQSKAVARIETEPGKEVQIDYAQMGYRVIEDARKVVYAYLGVLASSRLPYIEFCTSQKQQDFAESGQRMFRFFGGATERANLDNLLSGVMKADIYDPLINRCFAELCDYYGVIADPARPATPKDKGKVERFVQVARELWKRLVALYPGADLATLNEHAREYCRNEYGKRVHGTTRVAPLEAFTAVELPRLRPLPAEPMEVAAWGTAKVRPDQFLVIDKTSYSVPAEYIGQALTVRSTRTTVEIFHEHRKVRTYVKDGKARQHEATDFPERAQPFVIGAYNKGLLAEAGRVGPQALAYLSMVLQSDTNVARRQATKGLAIIKERVDFAQLSHVLGLALAERIRDPRVLERLFEDESLQKLLPFPLSDEGRAMTRPEAYYLEPTKPR